MVIVLLVGEYKIYLYVGHLFMNIPNIITLLHVACWAGVIILSSQWRLYWACGLLVCCVVLDMVDGFVARYLGQTSELGMQLDSLADVISFGVWSAMIGLLLLDDWWWYTLLLILFVMAWAWRLARHNALEYSHISSLNLPVPQKKSLKTASQQIWPQQIWSHEWLWMPITVNGVVMPLLIRWNVAGEIVMVWMVISSLLMISTIRIRKPSLLPFFSSHSHTVSK